MSDAIETAIQALIRECGTVTPSGSVNQFLEADSVEDLRDGMIAAIAAYRDSEIEALRAQVAALKGCVPELPEPLYAGNHLPRFGIRWNGPTEPLCVPMDDGYWTPWHYAEAKLADCQAVIRDRGHEADCPASSSACAICGLHELLHPCVTYFGDSQKHNFNRGPCSDACGHDRTTGEKA